MKLCFSKLYKMFSYFSIWADIQFVFTLHTSFGMSTQHRLFDLKKTLFSLCLASVGGSYITYVYPRTIYLSYLDHTFHNTSLIILDIVGHHSILLYFIVVVMGPYRHMLHRQPTISPYIFTLPFLYFAGGLPYEDLYGLRTIDLMVVFPLSVGLYVTILRGVHYVHNILDRGCRLHDL